MKNSTLKRKLITEFGESQPGTQRGYFRMCYFIHFLGILSFSHFPSLLKFENTGSLKYQHKTDKLLHLANLKLGRFQFFVRIQDRKWIVSWFWNVFLDPLQRIFLFRCCPFLGRSFRSFTGSGGIPHLDVVVSVVVESALSVVFILLIWNKEEWLRPVWRTAMLRLHFSCTWLGFNWQSLTFSGIVSFIQKELSKLVG